MVIKISGLRCPLRRVSTADSKNIVHRDLKPENLFVTRDGLVKILDLGLAKVGVVPSAGEEETTSEAPLTDPGTVMGTVGYMSPEQVRGLEVDARSDIFSLGVVLFEMLSSQRPFRGETRADTISAILTKEPPRFAATGQRVPPTLERVVRRCLEKRPEERFGSSHELRSALEVLSAPEHEEVLEPLEERSPYPGLSAFTEADAENFFGREAEVEALWKKVRRLKLLFVLARVRPRGAPQVAEAAPFTE